MFDKNKKYTMEEFKNMFKEVEKKVIKDAIKNEDIDDPMANMMISMVTMKTVNDIEKELFGDKKEGDE